MENQFDHILRGFHKVISKYTRKPQSLVSPIQIAAFDFLYMYTDILTEEGECDLLADTPGILKAPDHTQLEASLSLCVRHRELVDARQKVHHSVVV